MNTTPNELMFTLIHWVVAAVALLITSALIPGFKIKDFPSALIAAAVIGFANLFIRPMLLFLTLPLTILTLGLFAFVVNGIVLKICAAILRGFTITSWTSAILGGLVLAVVRTILHFWIL